MPIETKIDNTLKKFLRNNVKDIQLDAQREIGPAVSKEILELLSDGISPTQNGKFKQNYSERYLKAIARGKYPGKTISPVNLKLTGSLYGSLVYKTKVLKTSVKTTFRFRKRKRAKQHDEGLDGLPVRRLLPNKGEAWHTNINLIVVNFLTRSVENFAKRYSDK